MNATKNEVNCLEMTENEQASEVDPSVCPGSQESPVSRKLTPKRLIITFAACSLGVLGGTLVANSLNESSDSNVMGTWFASYGANYSQVSHDAAKIDIDSNATNVIVTTVRSDSLRLARCGDGAGQSPQCRMGRSN